MKRRIRGRRADLWAAVISAAAVIGAALPAAAADDCADPQTQQEMNLCAHLEWQKEDAALNRAYKKARAYMAELDDAQPDALSGAADALRDAQRAWIVFRDKACEAEGYLFRGGTMEPLIVATCKTRLTHRRTEDLLGSIE